MNKTAIISEGAITEREINERLTAWLREKTGVYYVLNLLSQIVEPSGGKYDLFTDSLDSMALITDAMELAEIERYVNTLESLWRAEEYDSFFLPWFISLDAPTRAVAAILALGSEKKL